jgi:hypothetical protein
MVARLPSSEHCTSRVAGGNVGGEEPLIWHKLLAAEEGCRFEALLLPPPPAPPSQAAPAGADRDGGLPPRALLLARLQDGPEGCTERLVARLLAFSGGSRGGGGDTSGGSRRGEHKGSGASAAGDSPDGSAPLRARLAVEVVQELPVPLPSPSCVLHAAAWALPVFVPAALGRRGPATPASGGGAAPPPWPDALGRLQLTFSSVIQPRTRLTLDLASGAAARGPAGGAHPDFDPGRYELTTLAAAAADGVTIPVTLARHRSRRRGAGGETGAAPLVLWAYGSFGRPEAEAAFDPARAALLQLGFALAIAHVRGGGWRGRAWAEAGRGAGRKAAVAAADLTAAADALVAHGWCTRAALGLAGTSAGGWLAGAALAARPGVAAAAALTVPCLDPLGAFTARGQDGLEWLQAAPWGDAPADGGGGGGGGGGPSDAEARAAAALAAWSPYQQLDALAGRACSGGGGGGSVDLPGSPALLLRAALHDRDVGFWDAAKAVARLRALSADAAAGPAADAPAYVSNAPGAGSEQAAGGTEAPSGGPPLLLLRVVPGGHSAYSGNAREAALQAAFLWDSLVGSQGLPNQSPAGTGADAGETDPWHGLDWT